MDSLLNSDGCVMVDVPVVSVIVLNYNGRTHLRDCLSSLVALDYPPDRIELIVVDNGSSDGSVDWLMRNYPDVRLVQNRTNGGFANGIHSGVAVARGSHVAFLNADMRVDGNWLSALVETLQHNLEAVCAGSVVLNWRGDEIDYAGRPLDAFCLFPPDFPVKSNDFLENAVDAPMLFASGGAMLIRRDIFLDVGGFDRDYFLYNEDVDLGWRLWTCGYRVIRSTKSLVYHRGGASSRKLSPLFIQAVAQEYLLYTLIKNLDSSHLFDVLADALWFIFERTKWFDAARLSLGEAIRRLIIDMPAIVVKREAIQASRILGDKDIFELCGHPLGFVRDRPSLDEFKMNLVDLGELPCDLPCDASLMSEWIIRVVCHAYNAYNVRSPYFHRVEADSFRFSNQYTAFAKRVLPRSAHRLANLFWSKVEAKITWKRTGDFDFEMPQDGILKFISCVGNRRDATGKVPHLVGRCNVCGEMVAFYCEGATNYRESLKCSNCLTTVEIDRWQKCVGGSS